MVRLFGALFALAMASTLLWLGLYGVERLPLIIQPHIHARWLGTAGWLATFVGTGIAIAVSIKEGRAKRDEDVPLTPLVRRLPSGLREL
jgi:hypothetical protein